jgi:hypothetical protein
MTRHGHHGGADDPRMSADSANRPPFPRPHGPASIAALRDAVQKGREPPASESVARLPSYWLFVIGTVCIGAFMGQVDSSIAQLLLPKLELEFNARLSTVSWVAVSYLLAMAAFLPIFGRLADMMGRKLLVYRWLPAVRAELGVVRPCAKPPPGQDSLRGREHIVVANPCRD